MGTWKAEALPQGLIQGGKLIGTMERSLVFLFILMGQLEAIGFLIAAKSLIQFDSRSEGLAARQYIIVGTFASFGWAIVVTLATLALRDLLPPLEIAGAKP